MSDSLDRRQLYLWFGQLADGTLSAAEHAALETLLTSSAEARRLWFQFSDLELGLADWSAVQHQRAAGQLPVPPQASDHPELPRTEPRTEQRTSRFHALRTWSWALAVCLAFVLVAVAWFPRRAPEEIALGVAVLSRTVDVVWDDSMAARTVGAVLAPGPLRLQQGAILLEFYSGARLILEGPAEARVVSATEVYLVSGRASAHVPPQASGFTVSSQAFRLVDRGTDFGLMVANGKAEVHVFQGEVELAPTGSAEPTRTLQQGQAVELAAQHWSEIATDEQAFLNEARFAAQEAAGQQARQQVWQTASEDLSSDPAAVVHFRFGTRPAQEPEIPNQVPAAPAATQGRTVGCERVAGRWPNQQAVQFAGEGDRIRVRVEQGLQQVTLLAWVNVQHLRPGLQTLLSADSDVTGSLRWELSHTGQLRLAIARDLGRKYADWEAVNSAPFVTSERLGQWLLLASTFDGQTIRHYGNGELIGTGAAFQPPALLIGGAEIGNWRGAQIRFLPGAIDEFALLGRALLPEELRQLYARGKP